MEVVSNDLQTKLDKVKSFMDNGAFVFTFDGAKPLAIHESQLFKNQLVDITTDAFGNQEVTKKVSSVIKPERVVKIKAEDNGFGILFDSGKLSIPKKLYSDTDGLTGYSVITPPSVTYTEINKTVEDKIKDFVFTKENDILTLYVVTELHRFYSYDLSGKEIHDPVRINLVDNEVTYTPDRLFGGDNSLFITTTEGDLFIDKSNKTQLLFSESTYIYDTFVKTNVNITENGGLKEIYYKYGKCFFLFNNGYVKCTGKNQSGSLGTGKIDEHHALDYLGCDMTAATTEQYKINKLRILHVKDIAIGPTHTVFLTDSGEVIGFGSNEYFQLGGGKEVKQFISEYAEIPFPDLVNSITTTDLGTIAVSVGGKIMYCGTFLNHELTLITENSSVREKILERQEDGTVKFVENTTSTIQAAEKISVSYDKNGTTVSKNEIITYLRAETPVRIMRTLSTQSDGNNGSKLTSFMYLKVYNLNVNGVLVLKEDGKLYYSGINLFRLVGPAFGTDVASEQDVSVWTPLENDSNDIGRSTEERVVSWNYFDDVISKRNKADGGIPENIFYKTANGVWIDWSAYVSAFHNGATTFTDPKDGTILSKVKTDENGKKNINWEAYERYAAQEAVEERYGIDRAKIPALTYIDSNLNVYDINEGDNIAQRYYTQEEADSENASYQEMVDSIRNLLETYQDVVDTTTDVSEKSLYENMIIKANEELNSYKEVIAINNAKVGKVVDYLEFATVNPMNPLKPIGLKETKEISTKTTLLDADGKPQYEEVDDGNGNTIQKTKVLTSKVEREIELTRVDIEPISLERYYLNREQPADCLKNDLKLTIKQNPEIDGEDKNYTFDQFLVWLNGSFPVTVALDEYNKVRGVENALTNISVLRLCENPALGEPELGESAPCITENGRATVKETNIPTELRYDIKLRMFGWNGIKIQSPVNILDKEFFGETSYKYKAVKFGDTSVNILHSITFSKIFNKDEILLFLNGAVVTEDEFDIIPIYGKAEDGTYTVNVVGTKLVLKTYVDYCTKLITSSVNLNKPGAEAFVKQIADNLTGNMFSIAFFQSDTKYKKVKLYRDRQCVRNYPLPGQVLFGDISYNDLILVDGHYIPYLWDSRHCIRFPETINTIRDSLGDFIEHSDICRIRPYFVDKEISEYTDEELESYLKDILGKTTEEIASMTYNQMRNLILNS